MQFKSILFLILILTLNACVKTEFDAPPINDNDPHINATFSISELKKLHAAGKFETINENKIIKAIVVANDRSGNYYKTIVVQDSTGGMEVKINDVGIFGTFPVGRRVYINTQGLTLSDYGNNFQVGSGTYIGTGGPTDIRLSGIQPDSVKFFLTPGAVNQTVIPAKRTINEIKPADYNTLIELDSVEFAQSEFGNTISDVVGTSTNTNRTIEDCNGQTIILRTSKYADFASDLIPEGRGNIIAIVSIFSSTKQLFLRERIDMAFKGPRCGSGGNSTTLDIQALRDLFKGNTLTIPTDKKIKGIVISDKNSKNINSKNIVIQQPGSAGVLIRFSADNTFDLGDEIEVEVGGQELSEYGGLLQINGVPNINATKRSTGNTLTPQVITLAQANADFEKYESELVQIKNVTLSRSGDATYLGNVNMADGTGTMILYTAATATFAANNFPLTSVSLTGYLTQFGASQTKELSIRNLTDVK